MYTVQLLLFASHLPHHSTMMSNRFKHLSSVRSDFACITQPDGEETPPDFMSMSPGFSNVLGLPVSNDTNGVISQVSFADDSKSGEKSPSSSDLDDDDPDAVVAIPSRKEKVNSKNWLRKRGARAKAKATFKKKFKKKMTKFEKLKLKLKTGTYIWTQHEDVADFHPDDLPQKGKRRSRIKEYGTLIKKSSYYHDCWVVGFDKGFSYTLSYKTLHYVSNSSSMYKFVNGPDGKKVLEKVNGNKEEQDAILRVILNSKIHKTVGHEDITYDYLESLFKPRYAWLTSSKLRKYVSTCRSLFKVNTSTTQPKPGTWLSSLPDEDPDSPLIDKSGFRSRRFFNQNSHKNANIEHLNVKKASADKSIARGFHGVSFDGNERNCSLTSNNYDDQVQDNLENHGLVCTCCGIRFKEVVTDEDMTKLFEAKRQHGRHMMITKVSKCGKDRDIVIEVVPHMIGDIVSNDVDDEFKSVCDDVLNVVYEEKTKNKKKSDNVVVCIDDSANDGNGNRDTKVVGRDTLKHIVKDNATMVDSVDNRIVISDCSNARMNDGNGNSIETIDCSKAKMNDANGNSIETTDGSNATMNDGNNNTIGICDGSNATMNDGNSNTIGTSDGSNVTMNDVNDDTIGSRDGCKTMMNNNLGIIVGTSDGRNATMNDSVGNTTKLNDGMNTTMNNVADNTNESIDGSNLTMNDGVGNTIESIDGTSSATNPSETSEYSVDPEEKYSRYVANGYLSIESDDEPINTGDTVKNKVDDININNCNFSSDRKPKEFNLDEDIIPYSTPLTKVMKIPSPCPYDKYPEVVAALANSKYLYFQR